jgi:actin-related protein
MMPGFAQRIRKSLSDYSDPDFNYHFTPDVIAENNRFISTWIGESMVASMSSFDKLFFTKTEYQDHGDSYLAKIF